MFLISEASTLIIFLEVTEKKLAQSQHVQSGWVVISSRLLSQIGGGASFIPLCGAVRARRPALPRSLSRGHGGWRQSAGRPTGGAPASPQLGDGERRRVWEKEWTVTVVPRSPVQSRPLCLGARVLPRTLGPPAARPQDCASRATRGEFPPQPQVPSLSQVPWQPAGAEHGGRAVQPGTGQSSAHGPRAWP